MLSAVAQAKEIVEPPGRFPHQSSAAKRAEESQFLARWLARGADVSRRFAAETQINVAGQAGNAFDVVARPPASNQLELAYQRAEFTRCRFPNNGASAIDDPSRFFQPRASAKVAE